MNTKSSLHPSGGYVRPSGFRTLWSLAAVLLLLPPAPAAGQANSPLRGNLELARTYFERAQRPGVERRESVEWLERSMDAHPTFRAAYELGKLQREAADPTRALESFHRALDLTDQDKYLAQAAYQIGITHDRMDRYVEARRWLRKSLGFADHEAVREALRELELSRKGRIVSAEEILDELKTERTFGVAKAELRVHFELNRASLDHRGHRQAVELGKALGDRLWQARGQTFYLLGHTDRLCPRDRPDRERCDRHNLELSEQRAATVRQVLTRELGLEPEHVQAVGCGRRHLLTERESADDHYLNRRVVVMAVDPPEGGWDELCAHDSGLL